MWSLCHPDQLQGEAGYYLTVYESSIEYVLQESISNDSFSFPSSSPSSNGESSNFNPILSDLILNEHLSNGEEIKQERKQNTSEVKQQKSFGENIRNRFHLNYFGMKQKQSRQNNSSMRQSFNARSSTSHQQYN
jgi:hypothetical protein